MAAIYQIRLFGTFLPPWVRPWDNCGKCHMDEEDSMLVRRIAACPIYLQPFPSNSTRDWVQKFAILAHFCTFGLSWVRPWDNRGKCYMDGKRIQCWSNALQHIPIYLQPFTSYSEILVRNCNFFYLPLHLTPPNWGVHIGIPGESLVLRKLESWGYIVLQAYKAVKTVWR